MILRCTKKLLDMICPEQLASPEPDPEDWYANLLVLDGRKCLLLTHAESLFTIFEPDVRAAQLRATHQLVAELIERELLAEELPPLDLRRSRRRAAEYHQDRRSARARLHERHGPSL